MKVVILAGGLGTRISEETDVKPKPMIEIGGKPIIWHIMKIYAEYGFNEFVILLGYKGYVIKEYFTNYFLHQNNLTIDLASNSVEFLNSECEKWKITLLDTGVNSMTGGRIKRAAEVLNGEPFLLTYGDGVADIDAARLLEFHREHGKLITMTAVQPAGRYGALSIGSEGEVSHFLEKPHGEGGWINGGFFVCEPGVLDYIDGDSTVFEQEPLLRLTNEGQLMAMRHEGFWGSMDTLRDKTTLSKMWDQGEAPWKIW